MFIRGRQGECGRSSRFVNHQRTMTSRAVVIVLIVLSASFGGCNRKSRLSVSPVKGRVTYRGQGVPNAIVTFFVSGDASEQAKKMRPFAYADTQGNFEIKTYRDGDGAPPGKYRVSVIAPGSSVGSGGKDRPAGEAAAVPASAVNIPPDIAKKYGNVDTAGIEVTVQEGENNLPPFELK